ncbi:hypothetical protein TNCV_2119581 [Trichonephila clavipes]|nr:hypothetical protein TNCV_2119581 [Trichonephila clavipes]
MVKVKPINISLNQHSPSLSVGTAISPTLTEEFIIHPSVYSEIEKLDHAKSDVLLSESESSLGAHAYAYSSAISFPNVSVSNVIKNSSYDLPYVKNFNTRNDSSSLVKNYKSLAVEAKEKRNRFEQTSRTLQRKISMRSTKDQLVEKDVLMPVKQQCFPVEPSGCRRVLVCSVFFFVCFRFSSGLHGSTAADSVRSEWPLWHAAKSKTQVFARRRIELKLKLKLLDIRAEKERRERRTREVREQALPSEYHRQTYL